MPGDQRRGLDDLCFGCAGGLYLVDACGLSVLYPPGQVCCLAPDGAFASRSPASSRASERRDQPARRNVCISHARSVSAQPLRASIPFFRAVENRMMSFE